MMKKFLVVVSVLVFLASVFAAALFAQLLTLKDILRNPDKYDGNEVIVESEVVGEPLRAQPFGVWINLSGQETNIGVYVEDEEMIKPIHYWGDYKHRGDSIQVRGIFNKNCPVHQEQDIHARSIKIIKEGASRRETVDLWKKHLAVGLSIICLTIGVIYFIKIQYLRLKKSE